MIINDRFVCQIFQYIPHILIPSSFCVYIYLLITDNTQLLITSSFVLIPLIIGSLFLILTKKYSTNIMTGFNIFNLKFSQNRLLKCYLIFASLMIIILLLGYYTSALYLILLVLLYIINILQLLSKKGSAFPQIIGVICTSVFLILPIFFTHAYYYDGSDIIDHSQVISDIISLGSTVLMDAPYSNFPGMHLYLSIASLLTDFPANVAIYFFISLPSIIISIFIYLLSKNITKNPDISLLSLYIYLLMIPYLSVFVTLAPFFWVSQILIILLYLIFRPIKNNKLPFIIASFVLITAIIITHHAQQLSSIFIMTIILLCALFVTYIRGKTRNNNTINIHIILSYFIIVLSYLIYTFLIFSLTYVKQILMATEGDTILLISQETSNSLNLIAIISQITISFSTIVSIFFILIGLYTLITNKNNNNLSYILGLLLLVFYIFYTPGITESLPYLNDIYLYRWRIIISIFFAIGISIGIIRFSSVCQQYVKKQYIQPIIVAIVCFILIISPIFTFSPNNELIQRTYYGDVLHSTAVNIGYNNFNENDMSMFNVLDNYMSDERFLTDQDTARYMQRYLHKNIDDNYITMGTAFSRLFYEQYSGNSDYIIFREAILKANGFKYINSEGDYSSVLYSEEAMAYLKINTQHKNVIFNSEYTKIYA